MAEGASSVRQKAEEIVAKASIRKIDLAELKVDSSYQREPNQALVTDIANNWDAVSSELLLVSDRGEDENWEGRYYVVNGQHRTLAATKIGLKKLDARVIDLTKEEDPARVEATFRLRTNKRLPDRPLERFKAQVIAGNEESIGISKILAKFDTEVNETPNGELGINPIAAIERIYRADNGKLLTETLEVIRDTWGVVGGKNVTASSVVAIAWFILVHGNEADRGRLVDRLSSVGRSAWDRKARTTAAAMGGSLWLNFYRAMVEIYNERLTSKSLEWKTKGSQTFGQKAKQRDQSSFK